MKVKEMNQVLSQADLLAGEADVAAAIGRLATEITTCLQDTNPVLLCIMNGGLIFTGSC